MTLQDALGALLPFGLITLFLVFILISQQKQLTAVNEMLLRIAASSGWTNLESFTFFRPSVRGTWRQFPVELRYGQHQKNAPRRLALTIRAQTERNIQIQRKFEGLFSNRPMTWFGPALVDVYEPSASQMWVRGDPQLAERLFADPKLAPLISTNMVTRFDRVNIDPAALHVIRSLEWPGARFRFEVSSTGMIAREMITLAEAMADSLR